MSDYDCVETYADWIQLLGDIYGEQDTANEIIAEGRSVAEEIKSVTSTIADEDKPKVLILFNYADGVIKTSGSNFFGQYWIETAGGINVAADLSGTPEINMEQVYEWDPDIIFIHPLASMNPSTTFISSTRIYFHLSYLFVYRLQVLPSMTNLVNHSFPTGSAQYKCVYPAQTFL